MHYYFTITGGIDPNTTHGLIHFFNSKILDERYDGTYTIYISSTGGDMDSAIRVYDFLKSIPNKIHTVGFGQIDSAAVTIFLAGDKRTVLKNTRFRLHEPTYFMQQSAALLNYYTECISLFKVLDTRYKEITAKETNHKISEIRSLCAKGKIFTCEEAKEYGIANEIVDSMPKLEDLT